VFNERVFLLDIKFIIQYFYLVKAN